MKQETKKDITPALEGGTEEEIAQMTALAGEVLGLQIARLTDEIIAAANEGLAATALPRKRTELAIAAWLTDAGAVVWAVSLGGASFEAPSVVEALRGLLAIVTRFRATTEGGV